MKFNVKNVFFLLLLIGSCAVASDNPMAEYFNLFFTTFSSRSVSKDDYVSLVSYEVIPSMRFNYDYSPPVEYLNRKNDPYLVMKNTGILFSGGKSRTFFWILLKKYT